MIAMKEGDMVILAMSVEEFQMTRMLVAAGAGDNDYADAYCDTRKEKKMCHDVTEWWRFKNPDTISSE